MLDAASAGRKERKRRAALACGLKGLKVAFTVVMKRVIILNLEVLGAVNRGCAYEVETV